MSKGPPCEALHRGIPPLPAHDDPEYWGKIRAQFPMPPDEAYCNTGTIGASPLRVLHAVVDHMVRSVVEVAQVDWRGGGMSLLSGYGPYKELRTKIGELINADYTLVALTQNATMGMNLLANGLDLPAGVGVLTTDIEHPGGRCGWELLAERKGTKLHKAEIPIPAESPEQIVDAFERAIEPETRVMSFPHISSAHGIIMPVRQLCSLAREQGIISIIDGAQATGHIPIDVKAIGCDAYYSSPHKWLMAPAGNGILYVKDDLIDDVWATLASSQWNNHEDNGYRLGQRGTGNPALLVGFEAALDLHFEIGPERIYGRIKELGDRLRCGLSQTERMEVITPLHPEMSSGLTTFKVDGVEGRALQDELWRRERIKPRALGEDRGVRYSTHIYNSEDEIDRTLRIIEELTSHT
ncbi:MAG: aminotransferase class V-fold PLP-dependent enzyme [Candidatus Bathyarchaeota archaeon]|nr:MAG: aminotransferase class V-fold PLP-dependent enzyme [Candidatus Bathyarchaeota archaeon]